MNSNHDLPRTLAGEEVVLLAERALYWPSRETLVVADLHWGKGATFRRAGIPIPAGTTADDLERLDQALERTNARRLLVLGDLYHARAGRRSPAALAALSAWRERHGDLDILLIRGNHDRQAGDPARELTIECIDEPFVEGPFEFRHHPVPASERYVLHGHLHPLVRVAGAHLPAFILKPGFGILPAFGSFTGGAMVELGPDADLVVIVEGELLSLRRGLATEASM